MGLFGCFLLICFVGFALFICLVFGYDLLFGLSEGGCVCVF